MTAQIEEAVRRVLDPASTPADLRDLSDAIAAGADLLYQAWGLIANAWWDDQPEEWREAALKWRDAWHATLTDPGPADL